MLTAVARTANIAIFTSFCSIFLPKYSGSSVSKELKSFPVAGLGSKGIFSCAPSYSLRKGKVLQTASK
jgi:hypothetical protein